MSKVISSSSEGANLVRSVLPSYGSDLHELKEVLQRSKDALFSSLEILTPFIKELSVNKTTATRLCQAGHILATDITNFYCSSGMSFRDAYLNVAALVQKASDQNKQVHQMLIKEEQTDFWTYLKEVRGLEKSSFTPV